MASLTVDDTDLVVARQGSTSPDNGVIFTSLSVRCVEAVKEDEFPSDGGGYADVWRGRTVPDGVEVALKGLRINHQDQRLIKLLEREISIWSTLDHPNVLPFLGLCYLPGFRAPFLVSPWENYGNVMKYLEEHEDADRARLIRGIADGLMYLHQKGIVHGDVKGANILVAADGHPVLADFGLSVLDTQDGGTTTTQTFAGSVRWMAPERLTPEQYGLRPSTSRTPASDVFSFGMTVYELYSGRIPFHTMGNMEASLAIVAGKRPEYPSDVGAKRRLTPRLWSFVTLCWDAKPSARPDLSELAKYLDTSLDVPDVVQGMSNIRLGNTPPPAYSPLPSGQRQHTFEVYTPCPFCDPNNDYGYVCEFPIPDLEDADESERAQYALGSIPRGHSECVNCDRLAPIRKNEKHDRCAVCTGIFCENIYGSCEVDESLALFQRGPLRALEEWFSDDPAAEMLELLTPYLFFGNRYEQQKFRTYLFDKGYTFLELLQSVLEFFEGKGLPRTKWQGPALADDQASFQPSDWTCHRCALDLLEGNLFEWYLHQRATDESLQMMSPAHRPDCPKGTSCQDAVVDYHHAMRFNHICRPTISQPQQAPSDRTEEGRRVVLEGTDDVKAFRAAFLPDQATFRDRDGQPCFMITAYDIDGHNLPGKATLWDWEFVNSVRNRIKPHFEVYVTLDGREYVWDRQFSILLEDEQMEWVRCGPDGLPEGRTAVVGGKTEHGSVLHHAAVWWQTRRLPGQFDPTGGRASVGYGGRETRVCEGYDVLCWK